jgi:hypothetical protein
LAVSGLADIAACINFYRPSPQQEVQSSFAQTNSIAAVERAGLSRLEVDNIIDYRAVN